MSSQVNILIPVSIMIFSTFLGGIAQILIKKGSKKFGLSINGVLTNTDLLLAIFLYGFSVLIYLPALKMADVSLLYPLASLTYVWVAILAKKYLKEKITMSKFIGISIIILGVILVVLS